MKYSKEKIIKLIDIFTILGAMILLVIAFILNGYNYFTNEPVVIDYAFLSATLLFALSTHFILSIFIQSNISDRQENISKDIENAVNTMITSLNGVDVTFFEDINDVDMYISKRILEADTCVYDFNW